MALRFLQPLHRTSRQVSAYLEAHTQELGVSAIEGHLLTYLRSNDSASVAELIRAFGIKQSTLTSILDRLEKPGLIRREMNPTDRRSFVIHITKDGRKLGKRLSRVLKTLEGEIRERVADRDAAGFQAVITAVEQLTQPTGR